MNKFKVGDIVKVVKPNLKIDTLELQLQEAFEKIKEGLVGCTNHNCYIKPPVGMGTNGACHCLDDKTKVQRFIYIANYEREALKASKADRDKEIADLTAKNEKLREALNIATPIIKRYEQELDVDNLTTQMYDRANKKYLSLVKALTNKDE